jgi:hypothetical protein
MTTKIGVTIATLLATGGIALVSPAGAASGSEQQITSVACTEVCPAIFKPVTCKLSDGRVLTFGNSCEAGVFACQHKLTIVSRRPAYV